jgi:predicted HAD superfamily hydrolase
MSIEYSVSDDGLRIETIPKGESNAEETIDYFNRIKNDKRIKPGAVEVGYFKFVTDFKISYLEGEKITQSYQEPKVLQHIDTTIFICETELAYGIGRMLQIFHEITNPEHKVLLARSETELNDFIKGNH